MRKRLLVGITVLTISLSTNAWALDWKPLHEKADREKIETLFVESQNDQHSIKALYTLALGYLNLYKVDDARAAFEKMLTMDPESIEARWGLAELARRRHESEKVKAELEDIIQKNPNYAPASITLAYMLFDKREFSQSMRLASKVIKLGISRVDRTNMVRAYLIVGGSKGMIANRGGAWAKLTQGSQVMGYLKKAQSLEPDNADVYFGLGSYYCLAPAFAGGDKKKGIALLEKAIDLDPHLVDAYARLAQIWWKIGNKNKYRQYLDKAIALDPLNSLVLKVKRLSETPARSAKRDPVLVK